MAIKKILNVKYFPWAILAAILAGWLILRACTAVVGLNTLAPYTIARDPVWYPLNLMGRERSFTGFSDELLTKIAERQGLNIRLITVPAAIIHDEIEQGDYDAMLSFLSPTAATKQQFLFSTPYFHIGPVLIVPIDSEITSLEQLGKKTLGVKRDSNVVFDITQYQVSFTPYDSMTAAFDDLQRDYIDGIVMPLLPAYTFTQLFYPGILKIATPPLSDEGVRLISPKDRRGEYLIEEFDKGLKAVKEDGTYSKILNKWGLINPDELGKSP